MTADNAANGVGVKRESRKNPEIGGLGCERGRVRTSAALRLTSAMLWMGVCFVVSDASFAEANSPRERMRSERMESPERAVERPKVSPVETRKTRRTVEREAVPGPTQNRDKERSEDRRPARDGAVLRGRKDASESAPTPRPSVGTRTEPIERRPESVADDPQPPRQILRDRMPNDVQRDVRERHDSRERDNRRDAVERRDHDDLSERATRSDAFDRDRDERDRRDAQRSRDHDDRRDYDRHDDSHYSLRGSGWRDGHSRHDHSPVVRLHRRHIHHHDTSCRHSRIILVPTFFPIFSAFYDPFDEFYCWHCDRYFMSFSSFGHHLRWVHGLRGSEVNLFMSSGVWVYY